MDAVSSSGVTFAAQRPPHTPANAESQQTPRPVQVEPAQQPQQPQEAAAGGHGQQAAGGTGSHIDVYA